MTRTGIFLFLLPLAALVTPVSVGDSDQPGPREIAAKHFHPMRASLSGLRERGLEETGLRKQPGQIYFPVLFDNIFGLQHFGDIS